MKKLFLFLAASTLALTSCSSDDDGGSNAQNFSFKVNGTQKSFSTTLVTEEDYYNDGNITLFITAVSPSNPGENITFAVDKGDVGANVVWNFSYTTGGATYDNYNSGSNFNIIITQNSNNRLKGTFSGTLSRYNNNTDALESTQLTEGSFDFGY